MLTRVERPYKSLLSVFVFDKALTLALGDDVEVVCCLALLDLDLFWLAHDELNFGNHVVFDLAAQGKDKILLQLLCEDKARDLLFQ